MAIEGDGFFQILQPNGEIAYTRAGTFKIDSEGRIVTSDGFLMEPEISIPADVITVHMGTDGTVSVMQPGSTEAVDVGTIELARFTNPAGLKSIGRNLLSAVFFLGGCHGGNTRRGWSWDHCPGIC